MTVKTYAVLGATGQTGYGITKALLPSKAHLNIYARSLTRLESRFPSIQSAPNVTLFIGDLSNTELFTSCLSKADVVLSTVAQNRNEPGLSVAQQTALAIIQALEPRRSDPNSLPTVVFLSSGAVMPDKNAERNDTFAQRLVHWCIYWVYTDLEKSFELFKANPWVPVIIAAASALVHGTEHDVQLVDDKEGASMIISYADLAKGMIMMGDEGERWHGKHVAMWVNGGQKISGNPAALLRYLIPNLLAMVCPPLWRLFESYWPR
jgi:putative NADH-flavin reductase